MHNYKKLIIATALALSAAAHADVTIYGFVSGGIESAKATGNGSAAKEYKRTTRVVDDSSRIGFKGSEDLGNGLKAIWQIESSLRSFEQGGVNDKAQTASLATRNSFVGLQSNNWGTAQLGYYDTAYKRLTEAGMNILPSTVGDMNVGGSVVFNRRSTRLANSVHYTSPVWSGIRLGASYGVDEARSTATNGTRQNNDRFSAAANYTNGGLQLGLGYDREGNKLNSAASAEGQQNINAYKLALAYTIARTGTYLGTGIERVNTHTNGSADTHQNDYLLALSQPLGGALTLKAAYARLGKLEGGAGNPDDYKARQWLLAATYDLSKRTKLFAYGSKINNGKAQKANFSINPIYTTGLGTSGAALDKGNDLQAFGLGIKTAF